METIKKRDVWSDREIREMLSIINEKHISQLKDNKTKRNKSIFQDIAMRLKNKNIKKSDVQIRNKYKSLKSDFFKAKRNNNKSGAKRQTSEHYELLEEILGHGPALETEGVDVAEMDAENNDNENLLTSIIEVKEEDYTYDAGHDIPETSINDENIDDENVDDENLLTALDEAKEEDDSNDTPQVVPETSVNDDNLVSFKRTKKQSYQNVVKSFTKEWKESQRELFRMMKKQDEKLIDMQNKKQEEMMEKNLQAMERILEKDREETATMLQEFLNAIQPMPPTMPYVFEEPPALFIEPSSSNVIHVPVPKLSPPDSEGIS